MSELKIKATNEVILLEKSSLTCDIEQFIWSFNADLMTKSDLQKLIPPANLGENYIEVMFSVGDESWDLIIEDTQCNDDSFSYTVTGKTIAVILAEPYAKPLTKRWLNSSAYAICNELCSAAGISLSWNIADWNIPLFAVDKRYPIDIITELVKEIGAKLQSLPNGTLTAIYYPGLKPADLATATALYSLDTERNIFERSEKFINRQNFNDIFVTKDGTLLEPANISIEEISDFDETRLLNIYPTPFVPHDVLNLHHASGSHATLTYIGTFTERQTEDIVFDGGEGRLSKAYTSLVSARWHQAEIGALKFASNGVVTCDHGDPGIVTVTYITTFLRYRLTRNGNIAKTLVISEELPKPVLTTGTNPALPVVIKTLSTDEALTARGNAELWAGADSKEYSLNAAYLGTPLLCGKIARVNVVREMLGFNAWVKSVAISSSDGEIVHSITVERPLF